MKIDDGTGKGYQAKVDSEFRIRSFSTIEPEDKHINKEEGRVWSIIQSTTAVGADDYVFYLKNTGTSNIFITDVRVFCGAATTLSIDKVSGTPTFTAGVDLTPVNRNLGSSRTVDATIKEDTNTTGLTNEGELFFIRCDTANEQENLRTTSSIIVTQGQAIAMRTSVATSVTSLISVMASDE